MSPRFLVLKILNVSVQAIDLLELTDPSATLVRAMYNAAVDSCFFQQEALRLGLE